MLLIFLLFFLFCNSSSKRADYAKCEMPAITWSGKEVKYMVLNITSFDECSGISVEKSYSYFTWNSLNHPYFPNTCSLFEVPAEKVDCEECVSGASSCFCEKPVACKGTDKNIVDIIPGIGYGGLPACQESCNLNLGCSNFTYFTSDHIYAELCILYSDCSEVDTTCSGCCSGQKTFNPCSNYTELNSRHRNTLSGTISKKHNDNSLYPPNLPDWKDGDVNHWYRFTGAAGDKMAEEFPGYNHCGSEEPMYLKVGRNNKLPAKGTGKKMSICQPSAYRREPCKWDWDITVMDCSNYLVYKLPTQYGHTYCGSGNREIFEGNIIEEESDSEPEPEPEAEAEGYFDEPEPEPEAEAEAEGYFDDYD